MGIMKGSYIAMILLAPWCVYLWWHFVFAPPAESEGQAPPTVTQVVGKYAKIRIALRRSSGVERELLSDLMGKSMTTSLHFQHRISNVVALTASIDHASRVEGRLEWERVGSVRWEGDDGKELAEGRLYVTSSGHLGVSVGEDYYEDALADAMPALREELKHLE